MEPIGAGAFPPSTNESLLGRKIPCSDGKEIREFVCSALELQRELTPSIAELTAKLQIPCQIPCKAFRNLVRANWSGGNPNAP
jgi:hypothetical protein